MGLDDKYAQTWASSSMGEFSGSLGDEQRAPMIGGPMLYPGNWLGTACSVIEKYPACYGGAGLA